MTGMDAFAPGGDREPRPYARGREGEGGGGSRLRARGAGRSVHRARRGLRHPGRHRQHPRVRADAVARRHRLLTRSDLGCRGGRRAVHREQPDGDGGGQRTGHDRAAAPHLGHRLHRELRRRAVDRRDGVARGLVDARRQGRRRLRRDGRRRRRPRFPSARSSGAASSRTRSCAWLCGSRPVDVP